MANFQNIIMSLGQLLPFIGFSLFMCILFLGGCRESSDDKYPYKFTEPTIGYTYFDGNWYRKIGGCRGRASEGCKGTIDEVEAYVAANKVPVLITKLPPETKSIGGTILFRHQKDRYRPLLEEYGLKRLGFDTGIITRSYTTFDGQFRLICTIAEKSNKWKPHSDLFERSSSCRRSLKPLFFDKYIYTNTSGWDYTVAPHPHTGEYIDSPYPFFKLRFGDGFGLVLDDSVEPGSEERDRLEAEWIERKIKFYEAYVKSIFLGPDLPADIQAAIDEHCSFSKKNDYICAFEEGL